MASLREVVRDKGASHRAPVPPGAKSGKVVFSSMISGHNPQTHILPEDPETELDFLFDRVKGFMAIAGGTHEDVVNMKIFILDEKYREGVERRFLQMYPDPKRRPPSHVLNVAPEGLRHEAAEIVITAILP
jgi:2-iminobutanoate/2-iminopropanoate deaminase